MAAHDMTPSYVGAKDADTGTWAKDNALFLKVYGGEVLTAFEETNVMKDLHMSRTISSGRSAQFPATGKTSAGYHVPGAKLLGSQTVKHNERIVYIDDLLVSDVFISNIDEMKNHWDVRSEYAKQQGSALARAFDQRALQAAILAARAAATVSGEDGGSVITNASMATDKDVLAAALYTSAQKFDEKDVPDMDRYAVMKPAQFYLLMAVDKLLSTDYAAGNGNYAKGIIDSAAGIKIVKSNNVPSTNIASATAGENNTYHGDFSKSVAAVFQKGAIGTVKLMDLAVSKTDDDGDFATQYQGTLIVAKYALGTGILRPECAIELATP